MKILLVHNFYGSSAPSGENTVFEAERQMLASYNETVEVFTRHSDEIRGGTIDQKWGIKKKTWGLLKGALCTIMNPFAARALVKKCREFKPDVVHFHNTFPLISPFAVRAASKCAPVVMTLHNYRMVCAAGIPMRDGMVCRDCFDLKVKSCDCLIGDVAEGIKQSQISNQTILPALKHRCYRGSLLATIPLVINIWLYRNLLRHWVSCFIVLSEFQKARMIECGILAEKIAVKGNFVTNQLLSSGHSPRSGAIYVGRLSDEKGVMAMLHAWKLLGDEAPHLKIIGDGDMRVKYEAEVERLAMVEKIEFMGQRSPGIVRRALSESVFSILPSECWETFGLTVVESLIEGTPCVVTDLGALPSIVTNDCGVVCKASDAPGLAAAIRKLMSADWNRMSSAAKTRAAEFSEVKNYQQLVEIYQGVGVKI
jgi:glycosyltransferase involved in cell wall biosynthesis